MKMRREVAAIQNVLVLEAILNALNDELLFKILNAKEMGQIDVFFYQSVPSDYVMDVISTM